MSYFLAIVKEKAGYQYILYKAKNLTVVNTCTLSVGMVQSNGLDQLISSYYTQTSHTLCGVTNFLLQTKNNIYSYQAINLVFFCA